MENPNFIFSSGPIELKEEGDNFFVEGYISTSDLDLVNDIVTKDCIMDMGEQMKSRTIKMDLEHESFRGSNEVELEINKTLIPAAKIDDFLIDKKGMRVKAMLNRHVGRFNELKNSIKDGFLDAFSIAFIPVKSRIEERAGQEVRLLDKINLLNVAFTGNPVNTHANMTNIFAKSLEFLKEQEKGGRGSGPRPGHGKIKVTSAERDLLEHISNLPEKRRKEALEGSRSNLQEIAHDIGLNPRKIDTDKIYDILHKSLDYSHKNDIIKLKEVKQMSDEDNKEETETEESETSEGSESESEKKAKKKPKERPKEEEEDEEKKKKVSKKDDEESESEESEESTEESDDKSETEEKDLKSEVAKLKKDLMEVKAVLKAPIMKSRVEQKDKSENFVEEKAVDPLDVIA